MNQTSSTLEIDYHPLKKEDSRRFDCSAIIRFLLILACLNFSSLKAYASESFAQQPILETSTDKARENLLLLLSGEWISRALYTVTKLEIADHLQNGPRSLHEIAALSQTNPESLYRVLHMLAGFGIFEEQDGQFFANTDSSALLAKSHPDSLHNLSTFYGEDIHTAWDQIIASVSTGAPAFQLSFKQPVFSYFKDRPDRAALFQEAMREKSAAVIKSSIAAYPFGQFGSICDVGGGFGHFLLAILQKNSHMNGTVFDLPEVIDSIPKKNPRLVLERCNLVSGNFFESVPKGADAYLLKSVLHDWDDDQAEEILRNCHKAMSDNSKLLIVEVVVMPNSQSIYANCMDVLMLAITGGKERNLTSFSQILRKAGFELMAVHSTSTEFSIIEAKKK